VLWSMIIFFFWVIWIWIVIQVLIDVFRRHDIGGFAKALWVIFVVVVPWLGVLIYLIVEHDGMRERSLKQAQAQQEQFDHYVRDAAGGSADEIAKAKALLDSVIEAKGGIEKLRGVKTLVVKQTLRNPEGQIRQFETTTYIAYPDRFRTESPTPDGGVNLQVFDGRQLWVKDARAVREIPETVARDVNATLRRDPVAMLVAAVDGKLRARALPDVKESTGRIDHALELSAADFNPVVLLIDAETSRINKLTFVSDAPGRPIVEEEFSDYRAIDGVQFAFSGARKNGAQSIERRITDLRLNVPVDAALFKRPS
jgi:hypothetical protein